MNSKKKALFIRLDRMGDLVLTLPCDQRVAQTHDVHWMIPKGLDFVAASARPQRSFSTWSSQWSWKNFFSLRRQIKQVQPDISVSFHVPWWVNMALWSCRVKIRGGVLSQWHSYLFLNKGLRQKRSQVKAHEMEYNYLLVEHCFDLEKQPQLWAPTSLEVSHSPELHFDTNQKYFVVHPGMGGSALNWKTHSYVDLINQLTQKYPVVITGTKSDEQYLTPLKRSLKDNHSVVWLDQQLNGYQLLKLLKHANAVIAPSTGVLHLSASLGATSLGVYSPIKVHQDLRWGPKGPRTATFTPQVQCKAHFECLKEQCPHYDCMDKLSASTVAKTALSSSP